MDIELSVSQMTSERKCVVVFIKQSSLCFREVDLHGYFTQPVIQVNILTLNYMYVLAPIVQVVVLACVQWL